MVSRGYTGSMPVIDEMAATPTEWARASALPLTALAVLLMAVCLMG